MTATPQGIPSGTPLGRAVAARSRQLLAAADTLPAGVLDLGDTWLSGSTPDPIRHAAQDAMAKHRCDHYTRRPGIAPLCKAVAQQLAAAGVTVNPDSEVVISGSVEEARFVAVRALAPGRTVLLPTPGSTAARAPAEFAGAPVREVDLAQDLPAVGPALLVLANPDPATGQLQAPETLARIAAWATAQDAVIVADETLAPLVRMELACPPLAALPGLAERTVTLGSFANVPSLRAWTVSWFAGPRKVLEPVRDLKQAMTICSSAPGQFAALAGLDLVDFDAVVQNVERMDMLLALLDGLGIPYFEPHTSAFVVADVTALGGGAQVAAVCREHGVRVADGSRFGAPGRVRIGADGEDFGEAYVRLETALRWFQGGGAR